MTHKPTPSTARTNSPRDPDEDDDHDFPPPFGPWKPKKPEDEKARGGLRR